MVKFMFFFLFAVSSWAAERHFVLSVYDKKINVVSPTSTQGSYVVVMQNKTLNKMLAKVVSGLGSTSEYLSIMPNAQASVNVNLKKDEKLFFLPLSPAFQEVELRPGVNEYEIPPKS
jgi:hypothetical protein